MTIDFTQDGVEYIMLVTQVGDVYNIIIREKQTNLFVKAWAGQSKETVDKRVRLAREGSRLVLRKDINAYRVLAFIEQYFAANGQTPLIRDIAIGTGVENAVVTMSIHHLVDTGFLNRVPNKTRGLTIAKRRVDA